MDFNKEQEILAHCMHKISELDKKLYAKLEEKEETLIEDINELNLEDIHEICVNLFRITAISNCVMQRIAKKQSRIQIPGKQFVPPFPGANKG